MSQEVLLNLEMLGGKFCFKEEKNVNLTGNVHYVHGLIKLKNIFTHITLDIIYFYYI